MPDIEMCSSTVCAARRDCMRNWDSGAYKPDRPAEDQKWVPYTQPRWPADAPKLVLVRHLDEDEQPEDCPWYKPLHHFPKVNVEDTWSW